MLKEFAKNQNEDLEPEPLAVRRDVNAGWEHPKYPDVEFSHQESHTFAYVGEPGELQIITSDKRSIREFRSAPGATQGTGAGNRPIPEPPDATRTRFEVDHDRILWSEQFRILGDKAQAITYMSNPNVRNRATHCTEVSQIAQRIAASLGLQDSFAKAAGLGHDIGHSCCGHQGEDALDEFARDRGLNGFDHAEHGGIICEQLNLNVETIDAVGHHSWKCKTPLTPEAAVVAMADRIAYLSADLDDAIRIGILKPQDFPRELRDIVGLRPGQQIDYFIRGVQEGTVKTGRVCILKEHAEVMRAFRAFNYETIYKRPYSERRAKKIHAMVYGVCEEYAANPALFGSGDLKPNSAESARGAILAVAGLSDSKVIGEAERILGWDISRLAI